MISPVAQALQERSKQLQEWHMSLWKMRELEDELEAARQHFQEAVEWRSSFYGSPGWRFPDLRNKVQVEVNFSSVDFTFGTSDIVSFFELLALLHQLHGYAWKQRSLNVYACSMETVLPGEEKDRVPLIATIWRQDCRPMKKVIETETLHCPYRKDD